MQKLLSIRNGVTIAIVSALCVVAYWVQPDDGGAAHRWYSVLPPLLAVSMAIMTGRILPSLFLAVVSGGLMLAYHFKLTKNPTSEFAWKAYKVTAPYLTIIFVAVALDAAFHIPLF